MFLLTQECSRFAGVDANRLRTSSLSRLRASSSRNSVTSVEFGVGAQVDHGDLPVRVLDESGGPPPPRNRALEEYAATLAAEAEQAERDEPERRRRVPYCMVLALVACAGCFVLEMGANDWVFQPLSCDPRDTVCEPNLMLGPSVATMDRLGAKNDVKIQEGEWWRIVSCNWLHAGVFHFLCNAMAIVQLGFGLERLFGHVRIALLYVASGLFGTMVSVVFLPGVISVGASASVFGLIGACWADVLVNFAARCTLRGSGVLTLTLSTAVNLFIGLTPFVDNFMHVRNASTPHAPQRPSRAQPPCTLLARRASPPIAAPCATQLGGLVMGLVIGMALFSQKHEGPDGKRRYTRAQRCIGAVGAVGIAGLSGLAIAAACSPSLQDQFRTCDFCASINCVEFSWFTDEPWYSCCLTSVGSGQCQLSTNATTITAHCDLMTGYFDVSCDVAEPGCSVDYSSPSSTSELCTSLCSRGSC